MLWLALHLPRLPLEVFTRAAEFCGPLAIIGAGAGRQRLLLCNEVAAERGLRPGMTLAAAQALAAALCVRERNAQAERRALGRLAAWAGRFTSYVSLAPPAALLLEIEGSLRLFGGAGSLLEQVSSGVSDLGYHGVAAVAPTPAGALLLARAGRPLIAGDPQVLRRWILALPLQFMELSGADLGRLQGLGLHTVGDCLRLPRAGLARRIGPQLLEEIDRALGRLPDPRARFEAPPRFESTAVFVQEVEDCEPLLFAAQRQLLELAGFLEGCCGGVQEVCWRLVHHRRPPTPIRLGLLSPSREASQLRDLLRERLERTPLPAAVVAIGLYAERILALPGATRELLPGAGAGVQHWALIERLRARFGPAAVGAVCTLAEHRPEHAWRTCEAGQGKAEPGAARRPLWLLERPLPLRVLGGRPQLGGALRIEEEAERIESGWWDGDDVRRDYFVARSPAGGRYWIFRECGRRGVWFVHGIFE